ncbi:MAG: hypothetical protein HKP27_04840 [Myxococcales bacterium]|nr:hypothetical protein [Myxococcales bacterium]
MTAHIGRYRLEADDEHPHTPSADPHFNESVYTNAFDHNARFGGWFRLGNRANEGYAELSVCLYLPDGRIACQFKRPAIEDNRRFEAGGLHYRVVRPLREVEVSYSGDVLILEDPGLLRTPRELFARAETAPCSFRLRHRGCSPVHGGLPTEPDGQTMFGRDFSLGHFNQHTVVSGVVEVGSERLPLEGFGWRDHSWGPRLWQNILFDRGFYVSFGEDRGFTLLKIANRDGSVRRSGVLFVDGRYEEITDLDVLTEWDEARDPQRVVLSARTASWSAVIEGKVIRTAPLRNRRSIDGEEIVSRIAEAFTEFRWDGRTGFGMTEYVERLDGDGVPVGYPG